MDQAPKTFPISLAKEIAHYGRTYQATVGVPCWKTPKRNRAALAWLPALTCAAVGGSYDKARDAQHSWALLFDSSAVIDQIQDNHLDPAMTTAGALAAGVAMIFAATQLLGQYPAEWQAEAYQLLNEMLEGQSEDVIKPYPDAQEALMIAEKKAGAFMGLACTLGARCAGADEKTVVSLNQYGRALGTMIQIHDDLDFIEGLGKAQSQKPERFSNVALAFAWQVLRQDRRQALLENLETFWHTGDQQAARHAHAQLVTSGARLQCAVEVAKYWDRARKAIDSVRFVSPPDQEVLLGLIDDIVQAFRAPT